MSAPKLRHQVPNWLGNDPLSMWVGAARPEDNIPAIVTINQSAGSCSFYHHLSPTQAREMAAKLIECAEACEALEQKS